MEVERGEVKVLWRALTQQRNQNRGGASTGKTVTYEGIAASGSPISYSFASNFDGKDAPISATHPLGSDTVAIKRVDPNTITSISKKAGKTIFTATTVVSKDGKVSTQATKGVSGDGVPIEITTVWDKQGDMVDPPRWKQPNSP